MDREEGEIAIYSDISIGSQVTGVGLHVAGFSLKPIREKTCIGPGFSPVEAELVAILFGLERAETLVRLVSSGFGVIVRSITCYTDCDPVVRAIHDLARFRSRSTKKLVKAILKKIDDFKMKYSITCGVNPVRSLENPAHDLSREARKTWTDLLSSKAGSS